MPDYRFIRHCRTSDSEAYDILEEDVAIGRIDLHYTSSVVYAALALERELDEEGIQELIETIDGEIIDSVDTPREDLLVSVYIGRPAGIYSDDTFDDEVDFDEEEDADAGEAPSTNGNR